MALPETLEDTWPRQDAAADGLIHPVPLLSIIIPVLNGAGDLGKTLASLVGRGAEGEEGLRLSNVIVAEIIVADGGSTDTSTAIAKDHGAKVLGGERGRGPQLAAGAASATGDWFLFLHADTRLDPGWRTEAARYMSDPVNRDGAAVFRFALDDRSRGARRVEWGVHRRARWFGLPYGDQGLLISRDLYERLGGYAPLPLMEDVDMIRRIGKRRITFLDSAAITSAARYGKGYLRRTALNQVCLALYVLGVPPRWIVRIYK
ncbi:MAG: TIGR04283 family arsenosugar biosynthesis glycosyltransferase [Proteobacteria bacterium]|nr:TIGR04283 family arsenosugar biosynthesis glycosyltransferase [Pseudomonadota bacterium]